jgi:hypothetical protein
MHVTKKHINKMSKWDKILGGNQKKDLSKFIPLKSSPTIFSKPYFIE